MAFIPKDLELAIKFFNKLKASLVVVRYGEVKFVGFGKGVKELIDVMTILDNSSVADKVVGKAAAVILIRNRARAVYGRVMSKKAYKMLRQYNIIVKYDKLVDEIEGCPFEKEVKGIDNIKEAWRRIFDLYKKIILKE
ncbi:MAG: hypothetical protein DRJ52_07580 [Thermoprotei archaeon]|nr:MAG: hypothetical protein DRJ52_07580 [Thermoprotei archaeon]RLF00783.1 MAG: hypothetical protein DRJ63_01355 [Thermoprotei archaeon]HDI74858.1 DUF1893 domain-containing protein [Thermoprotei archaeon]